MKKAISVLLCLCLVLSVFTVVPFAASAAEATQDSVGASSGTTGDCTWTLNNGALTISGNGAMGDYYSSPNSFGTYITTAPWGAYIKTVIIEDGVTSIGSSAFYNCTNLTSVTIPDSVTSIDSSAFYGCTGLTSVNIPDSVTSIGGSAFYGTTWYNNQPDGLVYAGKVAYEYKGTMPANTSITLQDGTKGIADKAFSGRTGLTSVTIPDSVTSIGWYAFDGCSGLRSVTIGNGVTSIGYEAFERCTGLTSVRISDIAAWCNIAFSTADSNPLWHAHSLYLKGVRVTDLIIPDGVTSIGEMAFLYCTGLRSVTIPDSVMSIGSSAFSRCTGLTSVHISDIAAWCNIAFSSEYSNPLYYAHNLYLNDVPVTDLIIPDSVTSIGNYAFYDCTGLTSVTIPNSVTSIGSDAFYDCTGLTSVTIPNSVTSIGSDAFYNTAWYNNQPDGLVYTGKVAYKYKGTMPDNTSITIKDGTKGIAGYAFYNCTGLTSVTIPVSVTSIGERAFRNCAGLTSVTIPDSVTNIDDYAFYGCTDIKSVTIPDSVTSIGSKALGYYYNDGYGAARKVSNFTILGVKGSEAERYANDNGFKFIAGEKICPHCHSLLSSEQVITFAATCTEDGERYWQCDQCGELGEDVLPALGHDYIAAITPPTCTKGGYTTHTCSRCKGAYITDEVAAQGHDYQAVVTAPTCTKGGYTTHTCSRCKDAYVSDEVAALGHDYQAVVTAPTCTKGGYTTHTCSHCKDAYVTDEVAALGHDYHRADVVSPNCTEQGYTPYTCSRCSEIKKEDIVDALGHDWNITVKRQPTATQQGVMTAECQRCDLKKNVVLPVLSGQDYTLTTSAEPGKVTYTLKDKTYGVYETVADAPEGWFAGGTTGDCTWEKKGDVLIISGNGKMGDYTYNSAAPWRNSDITKVIIEQGVTSIGDYAFFECGKLVDVYIPQTVKTIGKEAFVDSGVKNLYIPSSVVSIDNQGVGYRRIHYSFGDIFDKVNGFTIYGYKGSYAEQYANTYDFTFINMVTKTDSSSGVSVEVPSAYGISVEKLTGQQAADSAKGLENVSAAYYIDVTENGTPVQPESLGYIKLPRSGSTQKVYRKEADGSFTEINASISGSYYVFTTDHCGEFFIADGIVEYYIGDANGDNVVNIEDVTTIQRHMAEYNKLTGTALLAADTNGDGVVNIEDATHLQRYLAEFDVVLG